MALRATVLLLLLAASACGTTPDALASAAPAGSPALGAERLLVEGDTTALVRAGTGEVIRTLPGGLLSPAGDLVVRVTLDHGQSVVSGVDLDGTRVLDAAIPGAYALPAAYGPAPSGFSPNGKWLVVVSRDAKESRFALIDIAKGALAQTVTLPSRFTFDAIHNDASAMYLIEHPQPSATTYNVRLYDFAATRLAPEIIFDKTAIGQYDPTVGLMDGTFHVSVAPTTGDWSFGLYVRPNGAPFVHALNVPGRYAQCIVDLEGTWSASSMFSLALSADARRLYVVDPVGGSASTIDGHSHRVIRRATFGTRGGTGDPLAASAVVSPDGSRLYATAPHGIAVLQTTDLSLRGWLAEVSARSLAISSDGAQLYALVGDEVVVIDARGGGVLTRYAIPAGARALHLLRDAAPSRR